MMTCQKNPSLSDETITADRKVSYLFTSLSSSSLHYVIDSQADLDMTLVDLSPDGFTSDITFDLRRGTKLNLKIASFLFTDVDKTFNIYVTHEEPDTFSRISFAGINSSSKHLSFRGTSEIINGAKRSDTRQEGRINNLTEGAKSEVSPILLIKENDVSASHGAAVGSYDPDEVYYLMSRGLTLSESKKLIIKGTLSPIIDDLQDEKLREEAMSFFEEISL